MFLSSLSNKNVVHGLLSVCTGMADVAFPIVVTKALLDRASHTASSYLPSRTSWYRRWSETGRWWWQHTVLVYWWRRYIGYWRWYSNLVYLGRWSCINLSYVSWVPKTVRCQSLVCLSLSCPLRATLVTSILFHACFSTNGLRVFSRWYFIRRISDDSTCLNLA